mmetsp:Transcript_7963/g.21099  ORF Transcript_7963/g.21099 Transcript_7963/m.21099 type:complete len:191 (-) Transcript_7963:306-878(-)
MAKAHMGFVGVCGGCAQRRGAERQRVAQGAAVCGTRSDATVAREKACCHAGAARIVTAVSVVAASHVEWDWSDDEEVEADVMSDALREAAPVIMRFMNKEHKKDLLEYAMVFGEQENSPERDQIEDVELYALDKDGLRIELMLCDSVDERCVAVRSRVRWPSVQPACHTAEDVIAALSALSVSCGLSGDI